MPYVHQQKKYVIEVSRRKLAEQSSNLQATPPNGGAPLDQFIYQPSSRSSGSFPAVPSPKKSFPPPMPSSPGPLLPPPHNASSPPEQSSAAIVQPEAPDTGNSSHTWKYIAGISGGSFFVIFSAVMIFICRSRAAKTISPWKTGLSGQLQKAFVTGNYPLMLIFFFFFFLMGTTCILKLLCVNNPQLEGVRKCFEYL